MRSDENRSIGRPGAPRNRGSSWTAPARGNNARRDNVANIRQPIATSGFTDSGEARVRVAILLVHDRPLVAGSIGMALGQDDDLDVVIVDGDCVTGPIRVLAAAPDLVLLDNIPIAAKLHDERPRLPIVIIGQADDPNVVLSCIRVGAVGCVSKDASPAELATMLKRAHAGETLHPAEILVGIIQRSQLSVAVEPRRTARLADRELEVLTAVAMGATSTEAAERLGISVNTLRTHLKNITAKLEAHSKLEAVLIAIREGRIILPIE